MYTCIGVIVMLYDSLLIDSARATSFLARSSPPQRCVCHVFREV